MGNEVLNTIYNESCLDSLKGIQDKSIDLVITSPPLVTGSKRAFFKLIGDYSDYAKSKSHAAVFPEQLVSTILENFSQEGQVIYDSFMGTGTTAMVAKKMGRHYIYNEISK